MQILPITNQYKNNEPSFDGKIKVTFPNDVREKIPRSRKKSSLTVHFNPELNVTIKEFLKEHKAFPIRDRVIIGLLRDNEYETLLSYFENCEELQNSNMFLPHAYTKTGSIKLKGYFNLGLPEYSSSLVKYRAYRDDCNNIIFEVGKLLQITV